MADVIGIRFKRGGRVYYFDPSGIELKVDDWVVVKTNRGPELAIVTVAPEQVQDSEIEEPLKPVLRKASPEDMEHAAELETKAQEAIKECKALVEQLKLPMKMLSGDYNLSGSHLTLFFSAAERVDFRDLVKKLTNKLKVRVELRQVGPRDQAKLVGGFGRCGRQLCCASFLEGFDPVSIRMAKEQDLPLNPMKISGICGRLMCCLGYEFDVYHTMRDKMPKKGKTVPTAMGPATVVSSNYLKETVTVELESGATVEMPLDELGAEPSQPRRRRKNR